MKRRRQAAILDLVDHAAVTSQEELRRKLKGLGFLVTQATLSRDLKELVLVKGAADGAYHRAGAEPPNPVMAATRLQRALAEYLTGIDRSLQLVVLKTGAGQAQPLALSIDGAELKDVAGTIAGDDTVLVVCRDAAAAVSVARQFERLAKS
jgi:transcriptional regulator of arginine metabolism